ncbi:MAG: acyltransferase family protein, partial [Bacteroidota bacterium]
ALLPVFGAISIILAGPASLLNRICLTNRLMIFIGLISYPLYLWHWPILSYLNTISGAAPVSGQEKLLAIIASFILAWATLRFIETPIRSNSEEQAKKALRLSFLIVTIGVSGYLVSLSDFTGTHNARNTIFSSANHLNNRYSDRWFEGNDNWLFLGNRYQNTVSKLTLAIKPSDEQIQETLQKFSSVATVAERTETHVSLLIGPNKSTIYPEFLPVGLTPSPNRYVDMFIDKLNDVSNLTVHDPSLELKILKSSAGNLYHRTDTHWNSKGAYLAFSSLAGKLNVSVPFPKFETADSVEGDLIEISRLKNFPLMQDDNWSFSFQNEGLITKSESSGTFSNSSFGAIETVYNSEAVSDKIVWVLGDSFSVQLRPFINHTFAEVHYVGHWRERLKDLASDIEDAEEKPDLIIIVRVERSF